MSTANIENKVLAEVKASWRVFLLVESLPSTVGSNYHPVRFSVVIKHEKPQSQHAEGTELCVLLDELLPQLGITPRFPYTA